MSDSDATSKASDDAPSLPKTYRFALSQSQKRRSKLMQVPDPTAQIEPAPQPLAPPPAPVQPPPQPPRRARLKRSGHMHDDLTAPLPDEPPAIEPEY